MPRTPDTSRALEQELQRPRVIEHPGAVLLRELERCGMTVTDAAAEMGFSRVSLSRVLHGHWGVSAQTAVKLEAFTGIDALVWMVAQARYDLAELRKA